IERFDAKWQPLRLTLKGQQFDAMLWLYITCIKHAPAALRTRALSLESWLRQQAREIYGDFARDVPSLVVLEKLLRARAEPVPCARPETAKELGASLRYSELFDVDCARARRLAVPIDKEVLDHRPLVEWAQKHVLAHLSASGIILELNPSS